MTWLPVSAHVATPVPGPRISATSMKISRPTVLAALTGVIVVVLVVSGWQPYDRPTWLMEVAPVLIAIPLLFCTYRAFPLTNLLYGVIFVHAVILIAGGAYTYARVPFGFWLQELLATDRNPYDKIGHFVQGLTPALLAREVLLRNTFVNGRRMAGFLAVCFAMAISAWYELIEWAAALLMGQGADEFLGTQGDMWDTQSDMFFALLGALTVVILLSPLQDRQIFKLKQREPQHLRGPGSHPVEDR
jgi:putative membrane protein